MEVIVGTYSLVSLAVEPLRLRERGPFLALGLTIAAKSGMTMIWCKRYPFTLYLLVAKAVDLGVVDVCSIEGR